MTRLSALIVTAARNAVEAEPLFSPVKNRVSNFKVKEAFSVKRLKNIALALMMGAGISTLAAFVYNASTASVAETSGAPAVRQVQSSAAGATLKAGQPTTALNSRCAKLQNGQAVSSTEDKKAPSGGCANCTDCNSQCTYYEAY